MVMTFISEKIPDEDRVKYKIDLLNNGRGKEFRHWLIDRDNEIFLLKTGLGKEADRTFCIFFDGECSTIRTLLDLNAPNGEELYEIINSDIAEIHLHNKEKMVETLKKAIKISYQLRGTNRFINFK